MLVVRVGYRWYPACGSVRVSVRCGLDHFIYSFLLAGSIFTLLGYGDRIKYINNTTSDPAYYLGGS